MRSIASIVSPRRYLCSSHAPSLSRSIRRVCSLSQVDTICSCLDEVDVVEFRERAYTPQIPLLIRAKTDDAASESSIPAAHKWFEAVGEPPKARLSQSYLSQYQGTILPYELVSYESALARIHQIERQDVGEIATDTQSIPESDASRTEWRSLHAPLSLLLEAENVPSSREQLYIAQAQIADLPKEMQDDLPTPMLVKCAGKGDIYDANIWLGLPPTYTPLHKDPNPNLFVQLVGSKRVRLFKSEIGTSIFTQVQHKIGQSSSSQLRGAEMMEGPERSLLQEATWTQSGHTEGFEAIVRPGDALFIPKGWWHSIKSIGNGINGSVNWWFR